VEKCVYFPIGLGTNRFPINGIDDDDGIEKSVEIVLHALNAGVNYIDVAHVYSRGFAQEVLRRALSRTDIHPYLTVKTMYSMDKTSDDAIRRVEKSLENMGLSRSSHFVLWSIMSYDEFEKIMAKGGLYEGAVKLRNKGVVDHITCSCHAPVDEMIKIIRTGVFEEMTISFNLLNASLMKPVLDSALECGVGIITMNSLGAGVIPQNADYFRFVMYDENESIPSAALRYVLAHKAVKSALQGPASIEELEENLQAVVTQQRENDSNRIERVNSHLKGLNGYCSGCGYCMPCPQGIPVSSIMSCRNALLFDVKPTHNRAKQQVVENINLLSILERDTKYVPKTPDNPCMKCGLCESKCTQQLKIIDSVDDTFKRADASNFSIIARKQKLDSLLNGKGYKKVGLYPSGGYSTTVLRFYEDFFGIPDFDLYLFNSSSALWGTTQNGLIVHSPNEIAEIMPDCILVANYKFQDEIYPELLHYEHNGIKILKLHTADDVPWLF